jgi:hypothetical protein
VVATDHGFVDIEPGRLIRLAEHPGLKDLLLLPLCGEPRAAYCYVAPQREAELLSYVGDALAHAAFCVPSKCLIQHGYFGRSACTAAVASPSSTCR